MIFPFGGSRRSTRVLGNLGLVVFGAALALGTSELLLRAFPNWVPSEVRVDPPVRRVQAWVDETYDLKLSDGDLFHYMDGKIEPISPEADRVVAHVHMTTDGDGFRNTVPVAAKYDIVALGDSSHVVAVLPPLGLRRSQRRVE